MAKVPRGYDVISVGVGEGQCLDVVKAFVNSAEVRQDQVDARRVGIGEEHAAVHDQQAPVELEDGHVPADLAEPAERDDPQAAAWQRRRRA
jgi:hypothetical protein